MPGVKYIQFSMRNPNFRSKITNSGNQDEHLILKILFFYSSFLKAPLERAEAETVGAGLSRDELGWARLGSNGPRLCPPSLPQRFRPTSTLKWATSPPGWPQQGRIGN